MNAESLNRTLFIEDNIKVLSAINKQTVDLIYIDPPYNSGQKFKDPLNDRSTFFKDIWTMNDVNREWFSYLSKEHKKVYEIINSVGIVNGQNHKAYTIIMAVRLIEMHRILKETGSIYIQCDNSMVHALKLLMDAIFGKKNFINGIVWQRQVAKKGSQYEKRSYGESLDHLLFYSKNKSMYYFKIPTKDRTEKELKEKYKRKDEHGFFRTDHITGTRSLGIRKNLKYPYKGYIPEYGWLMKKEKLIELDRQNRLYWSKTGYPYRKYYKEHDTGIEATNLWEYMKLTEFEKQDYKTQKPISLLKRVISASTKKGQIVLDAFAGCTTACVASEILERKWIGIDIGKRAESMLKSRLKKEVKGFDISKIKILYQSPVKLKKRSKKDLKDDLFGKQHGLCASCNEDTRYNLMELDHIVPKSKGGSDKDNNFQLLCGYCNKKKGNKHPESFRSAKNQMAHKQEIQKEREKSKRKRKVIKEEDIN